MLPIFRTNDMHTHMIKSWLILECLIVGCNVLLAYHVAAGRIEAVEPNPAVPIRVLRDIKAAKDSGATDKELIQMIRVKTLPPGYTPQPWSSMCRLQSYFLVWTLFNTFLVLLCKLYRDVSFLLSRGKKGEPGR